MHRPFQLVLPLALLILCIPRLAHGEQPFRVDARTLPQCPLPTRVIAIVSTGARDSLAVLRVEGADEASWQRMVRVGDRFADGTVGHIGAQRVWLQRRAGWCQVLRTLPAESGPADTEPRKPSAAPSAAAQPESVKSIRQVGDRSFEIDRGAAETLLNDHQSLMRGVQVVPKVKDGKPVAVQLRGIRDGSALHGLGLRNGDELRTINGFAIADPEAALQAYARLRTASHLVLEIARNGEPLSIDVAIR